MHCELLLDCHARVIMADAWKKLNDKVRAKKDNPKDCRRRPKGEELSWENPKNIHESSRANFTKRKK